MLINPCNINVAPSNTGADCNAAMKASAMLIMLPRAAKFTDAQITSAGSFTALLNTQVHAAAGIRWFPIFGNNAPIRAITDSNESDVIEPFEDGSQSFVRYGMYNRVFTTNAGGLALAQHLMAFRGSSYSFIEVDITGQVMAMKNADGSYSGFPVNLAYAQASELANLKTVWKTKFMMSFSPKTYIQQGILFASDSTEDILAQNGLLDTAVTLGTGVQSITNILVGVQTIGSKTDLVALYPGAGVGINQVSNFVVTAAAGTTITPSAVATVGGQVQITGTFTTGTNITVALSAPSVLKANGVEGYEGTVSATVPIP